MFINKKNKRYETYIKKAVTHAKHMIHIVSITIKMYISYICYVPIWVV